MWGNLSYDTPLAAQQGPPPRSEYPHAQDAPPQEPQGQQGPPEPQRRRPQPPRPPRPPQPPLQQAVQQAQHLLGIDPAVGPIIRKSASWLARDEDAFIQQLHYDIAKLISDPARAPAPNLWMFCARIVQSLMWVALTDQPLGVVADTLRQVGAQNWAEGIPDALYDNVPHALVQTVHYLSADDWSTWAGSAWISFFMWVKPHLLAGAQQAAAHYAAQQSAEREAAAQRAEAEREAARAKTLSRDERRGRAQAAGDVNPESAPAPLDDEDSENTAYGQIMVSMTLNPRRKPPKRKS